MARPCKKVQTCIGFQSFDGVWVWGGGGGGGEVFMR